MEIYEPNAIVDVGFPAMVGILFGSLIALAANPILGVLAGIALFAVVFSLRPVDGTALPIPSGSEADLIDFVAGAEWDGVER